MTRRNTILVLAAATALTALAMHSRSRARRAKSRDRLCRQRALLGDLRLRPRSRQECSPRPSRRCRAAGLISWAMDYRVDRARRDVTVTLLGLGQSRAVYRGELGCLLDHGDAVAGDRACRRCDKPQRAAAARDRRSLVGRAAERRSLPPRSTAPSPSPTRRRSGTPARSSWSRTAASSPSATPTAYGIDTPLLGFSSTKSVISALTGILVRKGKLEARRSPRRSRRGKIPMIRATPSRSISCCATPRALKLGSSLQASLGARVRAGQPDEVHGDRHGGLRRSAPARDAARQRLELSRRQYLILSQLIRDAAGGSAADVLRFARQELFGPLGMRHVTLEFDGAGTPEGSSQMLASARDWARFGHALSQRRRRRRQAHPARRLGELLGRADTGRVGRHTARASGPISATALARHYRIEHGWPRDAFYRQGHRSGNTSSSFPSQHLVIVRFGRTVNWPLDADGVSQLVADVIAATTARRNWPAGN